PHDRTLARLDRRRAAISEAGRGGRTGRALRGRGWSGRRTANEGRLDHVARGGHRHSPRSAGRRLEWAALWQGWRGRIRSPRSNAALGGLWVAGVRRLWTR